MICVKNRSNKLGPYPAQMSRIRLGRTKGTSSIVTLSIRIPVAVTTSWYDRHININIES